MSTQDFQRNRENFCYRHPDRQSFVLCQRCLRTICPECQTQGAVGVICPECLRDQQKAQSPAQKKAERRWSRPRAMSASSGQPVVTYTIIAITVFVYLLNDKIQHGPDESDLTPGGKLALPLKPTSPGPSPGPNPKSE